MKLLNNTRDENLYKFHPDPIERVFELYIEIEEFYMIK